MPADPRLTCPNAAAHTPEPKGYLAWHAWAARMAETHHQIRCSGCGRYAIWVPGRVFDLGYSPVRGVLARRSS